LAVAIKTTEADLVRAKVSCMAFFV